MKGDSEQNTIQTEPAPDGEKYADLIPEQLRSSLVARDKDIERLRVAHEAACGELQSTVEFQARTIAEQSETLENRAEVVSKLEDEISDLRRVHEAIKEDAENYPADGITEQLADGLLAYAIAVGTKASTDAHESICVNLIQLQASIRRMDWATAIDWLNGRVR